MLTVVLWRSCCVCGRWEAGIARSFGLTTDEALDTITVNVADMFGLGGAAEGGLGRLHVGAKANFVALNGDPLSLQSTPQLVVVGSAVECRPQQL